MAQKKQSVQCEDLLAWLNEAYAMELAMADVLEAHARDADEFPEHRERLEEHLVQTRGHAREIRQRVELMGGHVFDAKALLRDMFGHSQCVASGMAEDEVVRCLVSEFAAEHFEIACYRSIKAAARQLEQPEVAELCEWILREEEAMAGWVGVQIPIATQHYLRKKALDCA